MESGHQALIPRLRRLIATQLGIEIPLDDTDLYASGLVDSMTLVELLFEIEGEFQVTVELESFDFERARTLDRLAAWVHSQGGLG